MNARRIVLLVLVVTVIVVLDVSFIGSSVYLRPRLVVPLVLSVIVWHRLHYERRWLVIVLAGITGLLLDLFSAYPFGVLGLSLVGASLATQTIIARFLPRQSLVSLTVAVLLSSMAYAVFVAGFTGLWHLFSQTRLWYQPTVEHGRWLVEQIMVHSLLVFAVAGWWESRPVPTSHLLYGLRDGSRN